TAGRARAQATQSIVLGYTGRTATDWPTYVAQRAGFFAQSGLSPDVVVVGSAAAVAQQLAAGSLGIAEISTTQLIEAVEGGAPITAIAAIFSTAPYWILGKKGMASINQLKGKTIVVGGPNDITRVFVDAILERHGLQPDDYTLTFLGTTSD